MSVFREIKIQKGFGDNETGASGTAYIINMVRDLQGTFRTRYSYMSSASLGSGAIITDLASFGTGNFFAISNGVFYWSNNLGISWSACSGTASFTPTCGDWAVLGTKVIYRDRIAGRPIIFTMSSPPAFSEITTPAFLSNAAADSVKKFLFDYSEIAPGDEVMKRIVPFWTWMRNNIPLQMENLVRHPGKFGIMGKMKHAFEGGAERSKWLTEHEERPDWLKESLHFRLPDNFSIKGKPTIAKLGLPMEDLARMGDFKEWWSSVTPPLKLIPEYIFNKHSFFGSDIIDKDLLHDKELHTVKTDPLVAAPLSHIPGVRDVLQIRKGQDKFTGGDQYEMNAWAHHLYSSALRPVKEVSKFADPETAFITRLMNFAGPAKVYQYDPRRQEFYNIMEEIKRFRAILKKLGGQQVRDGVGRGTGR